MMPLRRAVAAVEGFSLYLFTGAACLALGTSLPHLTRHFNATLPEAAALGSAFAFGRVATVFFTGWMTEKLGAKCIVGMGLVFLTCFFAGTALAPSVRIAMIFSILGGIGMGAQDAACPSIFQKCFPRRSSSALSAGQAFFGAGCLLPSLVLGFLLRRKLPFYYLYYFMGGLCLAALLALPLMKLDERPSPSGKQAAPAEKHPFPALLWLLFGIVCVFYCATANTAGLYATSYAAYKGIPAELAVYIITLYNVGGITGSLVFSAVLRWVKPLNLFCANLAGALLCLWAASFAESFAALGAAYFCMGLFLGALFSILVVMAAALHNGGPGRAGAVVAMTGGGSDILTPLLTSRLIGINGAGANLWILRGTAALTFLAALVFRGITRGEAGPPVSACDGTRFPLVMEPKNEKQESA